MLDLSDRMLRHFAQHATDEDIEARLNAMVADLGEEPFRRCVAREIVDRTLPQQAVPKAYAPYRSVVRDGIEFFLSRVSPPRLVELVVGQLKLPVNTGPQERLLELAKRFATLHKLGQIIARNPSLDPQVKNWLVHLENGCYGTPLERILDRIGELEKTFGETGRIEVERAILAEASVAAVLPFAWRAPHTETPVQGVFKILKPGVRGQIQEELAILEETARFFEDHRERYALKNFQFLDLFREVRERLVREIDMPAEQGYLDEAARFYGALPDIEIPQRLPLSTATVTAMTYLEGPKITDAELDWADRRQCATRLFETLICKPLFSRSQATLFHGDPHAGNILAVGSPDRLRIGLVDWSLPSQNHNIEEPSWHPSSKSATSSKLTTV
jgi:ubiquinone biosynthesis protein